MENIELVNRGATSEEFIALREAVGWNHPDAEIITKGLQNTIFSVCAECGKEIVGYGRIIGDAAFTLYIQDIIIKPEFQRRGIGMSIMAEIMEYIKRNYSTGTMVCLMAAKGKENFYKKFGFIERPNEHFGAGMIQFIN